MSLLTLSIRNVWRHRSRSLLTMAGIAVAIGSQIALLATAGGIAQAWESGLGARNTHIVGMQHGTVDPLTGSLPDSLGPTLSAVSGVSHATAALVNLVPLNDLSSIMIVGLHPDDPHWPDIDLTAGRLPAPEAPEVLVGEATLEALTLAVGDEIELLYRPFTIVGAMQAASAMVNHMILTRLPVLQDLLGRDGKVTYYYITAESVGDRENLEPVLAALRDAAPDIAFAGTDAYAHDSTVLRFFKAIAVATSSIAIVMGALLVAITLGMAVIERRREIGLLRAVGWPGRRVVAMIVTEGTVITACGALLGVPLSYAAVNVVTQLPSVSGLIEPDLTPAIVAQVVVGAALMCLVGSGYPALRAVRLDPVQSLHAT